VSGLSRHYELYVELANALREGTYLAGDALPSEMALMRRFQVSRSTVRKALKRLEQEGRVDRRHGSGTYVTALLDGERTQFNLSSMLESLRGLETTTTSQWLSYGRQPTPPRLLKLAPEFGAAALYYERLRRSKGQGFALVSAYVKPKWSDKLTKQFVGNRSTVVALANLGADFSIVQQFYGAIVADRRQARHLGVSIGTALLQVTCLFRETSGHITHSEEWLVRPDVHSVHSILEVA
jgi:GntR family transcriptional regulator